MKGPSDRSTQIRMKIIPGKVLVVFLVFPVIIPASFQSAFGLHPELWSQKILIQFRKNAYVTTLWSAELLLQLLSHSPFEFLWDFCKIVPITLRTIVSREKLYVGCPCGCLCWWPPFLSFSSMAPFSKGENIKLFSDWSFVLLVKFNLGISNNWLLTSA